MVGDLHGQRPGGGHAVDVRGGEPRVGERVPGRLGVQVEDGQAGTDADLLGSPATLAWSDTGAMLWR